jgi:hypothetical protein
LHLSRKTLRKYIPSPVQTPARRQQTGKIDPFKEEKQYENPRASKLYGSGMGMLPMLLHGRDTRATASVDLGLGCQRS